MDYNDVNLVKKARLTLMQLHPQSLLAQLRGLSDPRRPQGQRYPFEALLGLVLVGALQGQSSLRGIWVWSKEHWPQLWQPLGFKSSCLPALSTIWNLLQHLDCALLDSAVAQWLEQVLGQPSGGISADGKVLRGSRRDAQVGIHLVGIVHHQLGVVLGQQRVEVGDGELGALLKLMGQVPMQGRVITLDAGLLQAGVTRLVPRAGGH